MTDLPGLCGKLVEVENPVLELDELWSFVLKKARKRWIWIALCRQTRQVGAFVVGDRSEKTCRRATHSGGLRDGRDGTRRAVESDLTCEYHEHRFNLRSCISTL